MVEPTLEGIEPFSVGFIFKKDEVNGDISIIFKNKVIIENLTKERYEYSLDYLRSLIELKDYQFIDNKSLLTDIDKLISLKIL